MALLYSLFVFYSFLILIDKQCSGSHIVGMASLSYISHHRLLWKLGKELQARGHKYTHLLPSFAKETYKDINVKRFNSSLTNEQFENINLNLMKIGDWESITISSIFKIKQFFEDAQWMNEQFCADFFKQESLITELQESVDLLLCDLTNMCCFILAEKLNIPRVDVLPIGFGGGILSIYAHTPMAYLPLEVSTDPTHKSTFSFKNRLVAFVTTSISIAMFQANVLPSKLWQIHASNNSKYTNVVDAWQHPEVICLIPHDFALEYTRPLPPSIKVIGAVSPEPAGKLPDDLNNFMVANSKVIVVSFGTTTPLSTYHPKFFKIISNALSKLPFAILWKKSGNVPVDVGNNVKVVKWMPQNDILGHPATKLFITHGGLNSFLESVYHCVPMVVVPLFGDQHRQATIIKKKGLGVYLDKNTLKVDDLVEAIHEVMNNMVYKENTQYISSVMKDRQQSPTEEGAYWIEYALRHGGAPHLSVNSYNLPEYQLYMVDVFLFILLVALGIVCMFVGLCYLMCRKKVTEKEKTT